MHCTYAHAQEDSAGAELSVGYLPRSERVGHLQLESKVHEYCVSA